MRKAAAWSGLLGALVFAGAAIVGGALFEGYSHIRQFISETYATGTPWSDALRFGGMVPAGLFIAVFAFLAARVLPAPRSGRIGFILLGVAYGLGTVAVGFFPCDFGCDPGQSDPSIAHVLHFAAGTFTFLLTPFALLLIAFAARQWPNAGALSSGLLLLGTIMLLGAAALFLVPVDGLQGLNQRIIEGSALLGIVLCARYLLKRS